MTDNEQQTATVDTKLAAVKLAMAITTDAFDAELSLLISAALLDLGISGIETEQDNSGPDALVMRAVITYCRLNFQSPPDYDRLSESYKQQKKNLMTATGYTDWGGGS